MCLTIFQLGETCLTFFSLVRHVSHLCETVSHLFQLGKTCVSHFSIPGSNTGYTGLLSCNHPVDDMTALKKISKHLGTYILYLFLMLRYNYLHCFSI